MPSEDDLLPTFAKPPLHEVALIVQFDRLSDLRNMDLLEAWRENWACRYPSVSEYAELPPFRETFSARPVDSLLWSRERPVARYNFRNEERDEQVQIQRDRFAFYWHDRNPYPRFGQLLKTFQDEFAIFETHAQSAGWGRVVPNQCAVSYTNIIKKGDGWSSLSELRDVFTFLHADVSRPLPENTSAEEIHYLQSFVVSRENEPVARLYVSCNPREDDTRGEAIDFEILVRGEPISANVEGVSDFFRMGRKKIVVTFEALTTQSAHRRWEKKT